MQTCRNGDFRTLLFLVTLCSTRLTYSFQGGERVCRRGTERPCYRLTRRAGGLSFAEALAECHWDGGELLSVESENEQRLLEELLRRLWAAEGDFWIGLRRRAEGSGTCEGQYHWLDGSAATYRKWHADEPTCRQDCVALHHSSGVNSWKGDDCAARKNFICKYSEEKHGRSLRPDADSGLLESITSQPVMPSTSWNEVSSEAAGTIAPTDLAYLALPLVGWLPLVMLGLLLRAYRRRKQEEHRPSAGASPPLPSALYEDVRGNSSPSGFVTNDIYEVCQSSGTSRCETGWVENEIYGS